MEKLKELKNHPLTKFVLIGILIVVACYSIFSLSKVCTTPDCYTNTIASLDSKKANVMGLATASTAASTAITLLPGDAATPIATKLADLSSYFLIILSVIYLEKYLLTIFGFIVTVILVPTICILLICRLLFESPWAMNVAKKLCVLACVLAFAIPASEWVSNKIQDTYQYSIQETIESAEQITGEAETEKGFLEGIVDKFNDTVDQVSNNVKNTLNNFIEALAIMIVTSCIIPIGVCLLILWTCKILIVDSSKEEKMKLENK